MFKFDFKIDEYDDDRRNSVANEDKNTGGKQKLWNFILVSNRINSQCLSQTPAMIS